MNTESRIREIKTGLFVIVALAILVALTLWVAGRQPLKERGTYEVVMKEAGGVRPGDQVRVAGVPVGRVGAVELGSDPQWPVTIRVTLDAGIRLSEDSRAQLASDGLLGSRFLSIDPGPPDAPPLADGERIEGRPAADMAKALSRIDEVIDRTVVLLDETTKLVQGLPERIDPLFERLDDLLSEENVADLSATLKALRRTLDEAGPRLPAVLDKLENRLDELGEAFEALPELTAEANGLVADLRSAIGPDGERLESLLESADNTMDGASRTLDMVAGNAGELEAAMRDLAAAAANLRALSKDLKERPDRLILRPRQRDRRPGEEVDR